MNFILKGNHPYRFFFYILSSIFEKTPLRNLKIVKGIIQLEKKRLYIGKIKNIRIFFRFEDIGILRDIFLDKVYFIEKLKNYEKVIDIGAHIGGFSIFVLLDNPNIKEIICIEPEKDNFAILKKNLGGFFKSYENPVRIRKIRVALSNRNYFGKLYISELSFAHSLKKLNKKEKYQNVRITTLDNIMKKMKNKEKVDLIKIDAEGLEKEILEGAKNTLRLKPEILIETGHFKNETKKIIKILKKFGYRCKLLERKEPILYAY